MIFLTYFDSSHVFLWGMVWILSVSLFLVGGCQRAEIKTQRYDRGLVVLLAGIEGYWLKLPYARSGLIDAEIGQAIEVYRWHHSFNPFSNLMNARKNEQSAEELAEHLANYAREYPGRPIDLVGYSGGGGIAVWAAERLPATVKIRNIILVHAAIGREYELSGALDHMTGRVVDIHSKWDWFMVGLGTSVFGTIDRDFGPAVGMDGFDLDAACPRPNDRQRLIEVPWTWSDLRKGRWGGHLMIHLYSINHHFVAPWVKMTGV